MIAVKKLDGSMMHINEDLIERVEDGADGQSAVYLVNGGHIIVANDPATVVEKIRTEKANLAPPGAPGARRPPLAPSARSSVSGLTRLSQVRGQ